MNGTGRISLVAASLALASTPAWADVHLASVFGDHMVLQRETQVSVWGSGATPGRQVSVFGSWGAAASTTADSQGRFKVKLKTGKAGGPYLLTVRAQESKVYGDVMLGEVWVCSGQSNMEMPVGSFGWQPPIDDARKEVDAANHPDLRLFHVPNRYSATPQTEVDAHWDACTPTTVTNFSATGYFFGRELQGALKVPVGLIMTCVGGTEAELWTSTDKLRQLPEFAASLAGRAKTQQEYAARVKEVNESNLQKDPGWTKWQEPGLDDSDWEATSPTMFSTTGLAQFDGLVWYRAVVTVPESAAGKTATLTLGPIDDADVTFLNGRQVGTTHAYNQPRQYAVPAGLLKAGENVLAVRTHDTGGEGGFTSPGDIALKGEGWQGSFSGWKRKVSTKQSDLTPLPGAPGGYSQLYNGMVAPLLPYTIRGAVWYQGESNVGRGYQYRTLFPAMIEDWRARFESGAFPFYFVQIAPFSGYGGASPDLREAQFLTLGRLKSTGMVVTTDLTPDVDNIHPPRKKEVGQRLADLALREIFHKTFVVPSGPLYKSVTFGGGKATVSFAWNKGMHGTLDGFELAGADQKWHPAQASVVGDKVVVTAAGVPAPVAVRYGWSDVPRPTLFNSSGLPASPFRSDSWERVTQKNKW